MNSYQELYSTAHRRQLAYLFQNHYFSQIAHQNMEHMYVVPSLIGCKMYEEAAMKLVKGNYHDPLSLMWTVASAHMIGMEHKEQMKEMMEKKFYREMEQTHGFKESVKALSHPKEVKSLLRNRFEKYLQNAEKTLYYNLNDMPVFLVPKEWLEMFYNDSYEFIPAIDTRELAEPMPYLDTDPRALHLNYKLKQGVREHVNFKIVSSEAWEFLKDNFGGVEFRRFNSPGKQMSCELWVREIQVVVCSNRFIHTNWTMRILASRFDSIGEVVERVRRILLSYQMLEKTDLKKKWESIKVSNFPQEQLIDLLMDEEKELSTDYRELEGAKLERLELIHKVEECGAFNSNDTLLLAIHPENSFIKLQEIPFLEVRGTREICLTCDKIHHLTECECRTAYFCSKVCKNKNKTHAGLCPTLRSEESRLGRLQKIYRMKGMEWEAREGGRNGIENLANNSYVNAVLQYVLSVDTFNRYLAEDRFRPDINVRGVLQGELACSYAQLVKRYYGGSNTINPVDILKVIARSNHFRGHNQQDAAQFLTFFLEKLHEDLNTIKQKPKLESIKSQDKSEEQICKETWQNYQKQNRSFISNHCAGQYRSQTVCPDCKHLQLRFDPFLVGSVSFPNEEKKEDLKGYYLSPDGEFEKVEVKIKRSMETRLLFERCFELPTMGEWLVNKKPVRRWDIDARVGDNMQEKGILLFYGREPDAHIEIRYDLMGWDIFVRRLFCTEVNNQSELLNHVYLNLKKPLIRAVKQDQLLFLEDDDYLLVCNKLGFLSLARQHPELQYPLKQGSYHIQVELLVEKMQEWTPVLPFKFDVSTKAYSLKHKLKFRSIDDELSLSELLRESEVEEKLTSDNSWRCPKCKCQKLGQRRVELHRVPECLFLQVKRFNQKGTRALVYGEKVRTPLNLQEEEVINGRRFRLVSVVNHYGNISFGHYTTYALRQKQWMYFDDAQVKQGNVVGMEAYLLCYQAIN